MVAFAILTSRVLGTRTHYAPSLAPSTSPAPSFAVQEQTRFDWDITRVGNADVAFSEDAETSEIKLHYNISVRDTMIQALESDCVTPIPPNVASLTFEMNKTSVTHANFTVNVDIKQEAISKYPAVWTDVSVGEGLISMCVRVDLMLDDAFNTSVMFHEQKVFISVSSLQDFNGFDVTGISLNRLNATEENGSGNFSYNVTACQCDASGICGNSVLTQGDSVYLCLETLSPNIVIVDVRELTMAQGAFNTTPIVAGAKDAMTLVTVEGKQASIRYQLISAFFSTPNPEELVAIGSALLGFSDDNGRRLVRAKIVQRELQDEEPVENFNVRMTVESDSSGTCAGGIASMVLLMIGGALVVAY